MSGKLRSGFWVSLTLAFLTQTIASFALPDKIGDLDEDGEATIYDVVRLINLVQSKTKVSEELFPFVDVDADGFITGNDITVLSDKVLGRSALSGLPLSVVRSASPGNGQGGVAVTRETIIRLTMPLSEASAQSISASDLFAAFGGEQLTGRIKVSADRKKLTLFYDNPLPPSARIRVTLNGNNLTDSRGRVLDVDGDGVEGGILKFDFDTLSLTFVPGTAVCGRVFASELSVSDGGNETVNLPLGGVTITVDGMEDTLFSITDNFGNFRLDDAPVGRFFVHVDGRSAIADIPEGAYYPFVGKTWQSEPGQEVNIGEVFLPLVKEGTLKAVSETRDTTVNLPDSVVAEFPEFANVAITVPAGSLFNDDGTSGGMVGIAPVAPDRLPGRLPEGLDFPLVITVQTDGATNFDEPAPICFPNSDGLAPGTKTALWSFNHDSGRWEMAGPMTVSEDGTLMCTDPGVGILAPGWHGGIVAVVEEDGVAYYVFADGTKRPKSEVDQECTRNGCPCEGTCKYGKSVYLHSGEEVYTQTDLQIPGRAGMDFVMERTYRSRLNYNGPLGHGWNFSFNEGLFFEPNGDVVRYNGFSHEGIWRLQADGAYQAPPGYFSVLERSQDGGFVLTESDGFKRSYFSNGRLFSWEDRFGNRMLFQYDAFGYLSTVVDVFGREIDFAFEEQPDGEKRLVKIKDFSGRTITYDYDANGDLVSCTGPVIINTPHGNDFPLGRTEAYTYSSGFADERLNHNLLSVTAPAEVAVGGPPRLSWTYGNDVNDPETFDRVLSETEGGMNASGVEAGGTSTFIYEMLNENEPPNQPDLPRGKATITDRNGNVMEYFVNEFQHHIITREYTRGLREDDPEFFETINRFDRDGQLIERIHPEGNRTLYAYDESGNRRAAGNLLEMRKVADLDRGGGNDLVTTYSYEPLFNQIQTATDPRGNDPTYSPPLGDHSVERYTMQVFYDYQESNDPVPLAQKLGIDLSGIDRGLGDLNDDGRTDQAFGYAVRIENPKVELLPDSLEALRLGSNFQDCLVQRHFNDHGQIIKEIDAEGQVTEFEYHPENDPDGDGEVHISPFRALNGSRTGYLASVISDAASSNRRRTNTPPLALATRLFYDAVGNFSQVHDARGVVNEFKYNAANEPVMMIAGSNVAKAVESGQLISESEPFAYTTFFFYDANGRIISMHEENRAETSPGIGEFADRFFAYDILDNRVGYTREIDATSTAMTTYGYDANENQIRVTKPEGNVTEAVFDERDLLLTATRGSGSPDASTITFAYDQNRNLVSVLDAEDNDAVAGPEETQHIYDGFDRLVETVDPLGGRALYAYDPKANQVEFEFVGHPAGASNATPISLVKKQYDFDERNRIFRMRDDLFLPNGQNPIRAVDLRDGDDDGQIANLFEFDSLNRIRVTVEDDGQKLVRDYDGLDRLIELKDEIGNLQQFAYDSANNIVRETLVETTSGGTALPDETFVTLRVYDQLNRLVRETDHAGQTRYLGYDSRNNLVSIQDGVGPLVEDPLALYEGLINAPGNRTDYTFDGLERIVRIDSPLTLDGMGGSELDTLNPANPDGLVSVFQAFDLNSRLIAQVDDVGNLTEYLYDELDRLVTRVYPDDSTLERFYDKDDNLTGKADPNGTLVQYQYDGLNRRIQALVTPASGVEGTMEELYEYDGFSRQTRYVDKVDEDDMREVRIVYDSISRIVEDIQNGQPVSYTWSGDNRLEVLQYPGGRSITRLYDSIDRPTTIQEGANQLYSTEYMGPGLREIKRVFGNNTATSYLNEVGDALSGYDSIRRVIELSHQSPSGEDLQRFNYAYNRRDFRISESRAHEGGSADSYEYDSMYRLRHIGYGLPNPAADPDRSTGYQYDGVGNRVVQDDDSVITRYTSNNLNQYTEVAGVEQLYDANGNRISDGRFSYIYDFKNRLIEVRESGSDNLVANYRYHADGRRYSKTLGDESGALFHYAGWQVVEERNLAETTTATYVYGPVGLDDPIEMTRSAAHPAGAGSFNFHGNARGDIVAITDAGGAVVQSYQYDDFGSPQSNPGNSNPYLFQGRRYDVETGFYYNRMRYYDHSHGRFLQRDLLEDPLNKGNLYTYAANSPYGISDPLGLSGIKKNIPTQADFDWAGFGAWAGHGTDAIGWAIGVEKNAQSAHALAKLEYAMASGNNKLLTSTARNITNASKTIKAAGVGMTVLSGAISGAVEYSTVDINTSGAGTATRSAAVGATNALATAHPVGAAGNFASHALDEAWVAYVSGDEKKRPGIWEPFNNAGRYVGVYVDVVLSPFAEDTKCVGSQRRRNSPGWDSIENLSNSIMNDQGYVSYWIGSVGEVIGGAVANDVNLKAYELLTGGVYDWVTK